MRLSNEKKKKKKRSMQVLQSRSELELRNRDNINFDIDRSITTDAVHLCQLDTDGEQRSGITVAFYGSSRTLGRTSSKTSLNP